MSKIITTVGTSLFTNFQQEEVRNRYGRDYASVSIDKALDAIIDKSTCATDFHQPEYKHYIRTVRENIEDYWFNGKYPANRFASAEIASILKISKEASEESFTVHLLATDTLLSVLAAEMISDWFKQNKSLISNIKEVLFQPIPTVFEDQQASEYVIKNLNINSQATYNQGFLNLIDVLSRISGKDDILNITGGYKAIIPVLTIWGQLKEMPLKYIYNDSELRQNVELISIDNLPFYFDYSIIEDNYWAFEQIKPGKKSHNLPTQEEFVQFLSSQDDFSTIKGAFIINLQDEKVSLSTLGRMLYEAYENSLSEEGFSPSNLVGKVMEIKVYEYFKHKSFEVTLGCSIGQSEQGQQYDIDVLASKDNTVWVCEVKPENIEVLIDPSKQNQKPNKTLQYKLETGAFAASKTNFSGKELKLAIFMYAIDQPHKRQAENLKILRSLSSHSCQDFYWVWVKPPNNYKGNVNWDINEQRLRQYNFQTDQWEPFTLSPSPVNKP